MRVQARITAAQLGVAAFCAGNIMLFSISSYAGLQGRLEQHFALLSGALFLPALIFSARPYFMGAVAALRAGRLSIDVPMALALGGGAIISYVNLLPSIRGPTYFDSLAMLIFLLQVSRLLLKIAEERAATAVENARSLVPLRARRWCAEKSGFLPVAVARLQPGDVIAVRRGETVPADAILASAPAQEAWFSTAILTGEPRAQKYRSGDAVPAGALQENGDEVRLHVTGAGKHTRLAQILAQSDDLHQARPPFLAFTDRVARAFTMVVICAATALFIVALRRYGLNEALNRTLALLAVSCPCALAFAAPLAFARAMERSSREGVVIKNASTLESLMNVRRVFLDKTGTVTNGRFALIAVKILEPAVLSSDLCWNTVLVLESGAQHPVARALVAAANQRLHQVGAQPLPRLSHWAEIRGKGVSAQIDGVRWEIGACESDEALAHFSSSTLLTATAVGLRREGKLVALFILGDEICSDSPSLVKRLRALGSTVSLLSGDQVKSTEYCAARIGVEPRHAFGGCSPERKAMIIGGQSMGNDSGLSLMAGDGINDAAALGAADVGVALRGGLDASLRAADVYVSSGGAAQVPRILSLSRRVRRVLFATLAVSLAYNLAASTAAALGFVGPLFAAVLMPVNSIIVLGIAMTAGMGRWD